MRSTPRPAPQSKQIDRFIEAARQLGTDDDKDRFEAKLGRVARVKTKEIREDGERERKVKLTKAKARR